MYTKKNVAGTSKIPRRDCFLQRFLYKRADRGGRWVGKRLAASVGQAGLSLAKPS